jgi:hypothetical protein
MARGMSPRATRFSAKGVGSGFRENDLPLKNDFSAKPTPDALALHTFAGMKQSVALGNVAKLPCFAEQSAVCATIAPLPNPIPSMVNYIILISTATSGLRKGWKDDG